MKERLPYGIKKQTGSLLLFSAMLLVFLVSSFVCLSLLIFLIKQVFFYKLDLLDHKVFGYLLPYVTDTNTMIIQWFTILGSHWFLIPAWLLVFCWYIFIRKNKWRFIKSFLSALLSLGLMFSLKFFFNQPRPLIPLLHEAPGLSFPSGHAFMSTVFFGMFIQNIYTGSGDKWLKWTLISSLSVIILIIGLSRVYLRLHYTSDVIAGFFYGILSLMLLSWTVNKIEKRNAELNAFP